LWSEACGYQESNAKTFREDGFKTFHCPLKYVLDIFQRIVEELTIILQVGEIE
jgi:hypothetical protein